jgi:hypothetical protein
LNLKNYTSTVPVINSINKIEYRLAQAGATHIGKTYEKERPTGLMFQLMINNIPNTFQIPAKTEKVYHYMYSQKRKRPTAIQADSIRQQADRTAWKILADWVDIQITLIQMEQAEAAEIFLPYHFNHKTGQTLFQEVKENNFKYLLNA